MKACSKHGTLATFGCKECWFNVCRALQLTQFKDAVIDKDGVLT